MPLAMFIKTILTSRPVFRTASAGMTKNPATLSYMTQSHPEAALALLGESNQHARANFPRLRSAGIRNN